MKDLLKRFGLDGFIILLFIAIFLAWLYPAPGAVEWHGVSLSDVAHWGVSVIFFLYGLRLNWSEIYSGLSNYKLHLVTQSGVFIIFPLVVLPAVAGDFFSVGAAVNRVVFRCDGQYR